MLPAEVRIIIYTNLLRGGKYIIADPEADFRYSSSGFRYLKTGYRPPPYAGLLLASKSISEELQEVLYKTCVFGAYLCKHSDRVLRSPCPKVFARLQKVELFLDLEAYRKLLNGLMIDPERFYHEWLEVFSGFENHREYCRVTISNIGFSNWPYQTNSLIHTVLYQKFLQACKKFVGFQTVILELGRRPSSHFNMWSRESYYEAATGPVQHPKHAGEAFEALKSRLEKELKPFLGSCIYYDRGHFRCLEFRPRDTVNAIPPGQKPFIEPTDS